MKRSSLLYLALTTALLTGLAHLRADWLGTSGRTQEAAEPAPTAAVLAASRNEPHVDWHFVRPR